MSVSVKTKNLPKVFSVGDRVKKPSFNDVGFNYGVVEVVPEDTLKEVFVRWHPGYASWTWTRALTLVEPAANELVEA